MNISILSTILCAALLTGCGSLAYAAPMATPTMPLEGLKTAQISTETPTPTQTTDYIMTANVAQTAEIDARRTAEAAGIQAAQITAEHEVRLFEQSAWTVTADEIARQADMYTATAYATSVPATRTQQAAARIAQQTAMVMTITAPTQLVAIARAETYARYSDDMQLAELMVQGAASVLMVALAGSVVYFVATARRREDPLPDVPMGFAPVEPLTAEQQTVLHIRTDTGNGFTRTERTVIPCTREQFSALVDGVLGGQSLAYNVWEGAGRPFTRDQFTAVRNWLLSNRMAQSAGQGALILSALGESLFIEWQNNQSLPESYKFSEVV